MAEAEQPERLAPTARSPSTTCASSMGASTPHFALQLRNRIRTLIARPARRPSRRGSTASRRSRGSPPRLHRRGPRRRPSRPACARCPRVNEHRAAALPRRAPRLAERAVERAAPPRAACELGPPRRGGAQRRADDPARAAAAPTRATKARRTPPARPPRRGPAAPRRGARAALDGHRPPTRAGRAVVRRSRHRPCDARPTASPARS